MTERGYKGRVGWRKGKGKLSNYINLNKKKIKS